MKRALLVGLEVSARLVVVLAFYRVLDSVICVPLLFWNETVPVYKFLMMVWMGLDPPGDAMEAVRRACLCVWVSAVPIALAWLYGLWRILAPHSLKKRQDAADAGRRGPLTRLLAFVAYR